MKIKISDKYFSYLLLIILCKYVWFIGSKREALEPDLVIDFLSIIQYIHKNGSFYMNVWIFTIWKKLNPSLDRMCFLQFKIILYTSHCPCTWSSSFLHSLSACAKCTKLELSIVPSFTILAENIFKKLLSYTFLQLQSLGNLKSSHSSLELVLDVTLLLAIDKCSLVLEERDEVVPFPAVSLRDVII